MIADSLRPSASKRDGETDSKEGIADTLTSLSLSGRLSQQTSPMAQALNAGIKRNRGRAGVVVVEKKIKLEAGLVSALDEARMASGNLSLSLYIERLARQLEAELGALPVLASTLDSTEVPNKTAA